MKRVNWALAALVPILFLVGSVSAPAAAAPQATEHAASAAVPVIASTPFLRNANSGKCLTVRGTAANAPAVQSTCTGLADQHWTYPTIVGRPSQIRNGNSGMCLVARGHADNTPVVQTRCAGFADQQWRIRKILNDSRFWLWNVNSAKCLLVRGHGQDARAVQHKCAYFNDQLWF